MPDEATEVVKMAATAASVGGMARLFMALHGGERRWIALAIETGLGATLGLMAAGFAVWWDPSLRDAGWPLLMVSGFAGAMGALGTRVLDLVMEVLKRRAGLG